jgi:hypothetical protein
MNKFMGYVALFSMVFSLNVAPVLAVDHSTSEQVGNSANEMGAIFVEGATKVAQVFEVTTKIVVGGVTYVALKGLQGTVWVTEEAVAGAKWLAQGAKVIIVKTARGIQWVAVKSLELGEFVLDGIVDAGRIVVEKVVYVAIKVEEGVAYVAEQAVKAGQAVVRGVKYVAVKTADGIVYVSQATYNAIKTGINWTVEQTIRVNIRTRLAASMALRSGVPSTTMDFFKAQATNPRNSAGLKRLASAALNASQAFTSAFAQ